MRSFLLAISALAGAGAASSASAAVVLEAESNDTLATAQNLDASFTLEADPDIQESTNIPHATVQSLGNNGTYDVYGFTVSQAGSRGLFDIDYALDYVGNDFDAYLRLFDALGNSLASNDDFSTSAGAGGSVHGYDSYLEYTFGDTGSYFIRVGNCCEGATSNDGSTYELQVSIENHAVNAAVPEPSTWAMMLLGFGFVGGAMRSANRRQKITVTYA